MRIDSHQHFWRFDPDRDTWITPDMAAIQRDFLPEDLLPLLQKNNFDGCITVQSHQSEEETLFQLGNAEKHDFIKGVVGWIDLQADDIEARLEKFTSYKKLKGFRHVLQAETDRALMLKPAFMNGIKYLQQHGYTYDLLILPDQLPYACQLAAAFPEQIFIVDHIAKPLIKERQLNNWKKDINALAAFPNVWCKISGMVTEADWRFWEKEDFTVFLDTVTNAFGTKRILFGSDWPVCLVAATYEEVVDIATGYFSSLTEQEQNSFFGGNAAECYKLN